MPNLSVPNIVDSSNVLYLIFIDFINCSAYDVKIQARGRALCLTDLQMSIPVGCYGRVAPRSGLALRHGIDVGGKLLISFQLALKLYFCFQPELLTKIIVGMLESCFSTTLMMIFKLRLGTALPKSFAREFSTLCRKKCLNLRALSEGLTALDQPESNLCLQV